MWTAVGTQELIVAGSEGDHLTVLECGRAGGAHVYLMRSQLLLLLLEVLENEVDSIPNNSHEMVMINVITH